MSRQTTLGHFGRNIVMETKVTDFVSTMSRTIKINHCSKLFVNQQGLSVHEKCVHGVSGITKAPGKGVQPKKDPVCETDSEIKIAAPSSGETKSRQRGASRQEQYLVQFKARVSMTLKLGD